MSLNNRTFAFLALAGVSPFAIFAAPAYAQASPASLSGMVTSTTEGAMEGVIVSAKRNDSPITVSVVTDAQGRYNFPSGRLPPGKYTLSLRAVGYDLSSPATIDLSGHEPAQKDLALVKTGNLSLQLSNAEWLISMSGTPRQKASFMHCGECHTLQRPVFSQYNAKDMANVVHRMDLHTTNAAPNHPFLMQAAESELDKPPNPKEAALGAYIATINLSSGDKSPYPLKTLPRPTGKATQVIFTSYDLPRQDSAPHDAMADKDGNVWYSDFQSPVLGKLDPRTGKVVEYPIPLNKSVEKGFPTGGLQMAIDKDGYIWEGTMGQAQVVRFDPKTEKMQTWVAPDAESVPDMRLTFVDPYFQSVNGKVWLAEAGLPGGNTAFQLDPKTGEFTRVPHPAGAPLSAPYNVIANSKNDLYGMNMTNDYIWHVDAKTLRTDFYKIPVSGAGGRRGHIDSRDRLWWAQYYGNSFAMFDPQTEQIKEWKAPTPFDDPYDAQFDDKTYLWGGGMDSDRVQRLNVDTGEFTEYLLPRQSNIRRVDVQKSGPLSSLWIGDQQNGKIIHVEPLAP